MLKVIVIRHTTPDIRLGICYGETDVELSATFKTEVDNIKKKLTNSVSTNLQGNLQKIYKF